MTPKLARIVDAVVDRLRAIRQVDGYFTNLGFSVVTDPAEQDEGTLLVYLDGPRALDTAGTRRVKTSQAITIEAAAARDDTSAHHQGARLLADIQRAIEVGDGTLGGLLVTDKQSATGLVWQSDEILYPEAAEGQVGAKVIYQIPHIRRAGDPENV